MLAGMARTGRPKAGLTVTEEERPTLERWARRATSAQALAQRCRIVLACADGKDNKEVAAELRGGLRPAAPGRVCPSAFAGLRSGQPPMRAPQLWS
jgi:hypothetical protein